MSRRRSGIEIYSLEDFRKADRLGRIRMHMLEPEKFCLDDQDERYYRMLQQAYQLVFDELRQSVAIRVIQETIPEAESWYMANRLLRDIYELFAPFVNKNKELRRAILVEKLYHLARVAEKNALVTYTDEKGIETEVANADWMEMAQRLYTQAGKFEGLDQHEAALIDPDEIQIPAIEITADPQAFLAAQAEESDEEADDYDDE